MELRIDTRDIERMRSAFARFSDRRFASGLAEAVNKTAREVRDVWGGHIATAIDRPTQPTRNAAKVARTADVGALVAEVRLAPTIGNDGIPPSEYLGTQEFGGDRRLKKFERALVAAGAMPPGHFVVPGNAARRDGFGNIAKGQIVQVLNQLAGSVVTAGYRQVISAKAGTRARSAARAGRRYVAIVRKTGRLEAGVYQRDSRAGDRERSVLVPIFFFVSRVSYDRRLTLMQRARVVTQRDLSVNIGAAMRRRLDSLLARESAR